MQQKLDYLDVLIKESKKDVTCSEYYNKKLIGKLHDSRKKQYIKEKYRTAGLSLIMSGCFMFIFFTSNLNYHIACMQYKVKSNISIVQNDYKKFDIIKIITGEWF